MRSVTSFPDRGELKKVRRVEQDEVHEAFQLHLSSYRALAGTPFNEIFFSLVRDVSYFGHVSPYVDLNVLTLCNEAATNDSKAEKAN